MRRVALPTALLVALALLAGCTAGPAGTATTTDTMTTPDGGPADCNPADRETVDPYRDDVEPSDLPDHPATLNRSSVRAYVVAYEQAYARNGHLGRGSTRVSTSVSDVRVEETDGGWVVRLTSRTNTWAAGTDTSDGTPTEVHGDGARLPVLYEMADDRLVRAEGDYGETPAPGDGTTLECL